MFFLYIIEKRWKVKVNATCVLVYYFFRPLDPAWGQSEYNGYSRVNQCLLAIFVYDALFQFCFYLGLLC